MKVLIADDEFNVRDVIRHVGQWEANGVIQLLEAKNGDEAKDIIETEKPEIIFTDIKMPKMSGIELLEWLNSISYTGKVILITGFDDYTFMRKAIQFNSFDYLLKPIEPDAFNQTLERAIDEWKSEEEKRSYEETGLYEEAKKLQLSQLVWAVCSGDMTDLPHLQSALPATEVYDVTLLSFYQMHQPAPYIQALADELVERKLGHAFELQRDATLCLVITIQGHWLDVEKWISHHVDLPVRLVSQPLPSLEHLPAAFQSLQQEMEQQNFRSIHRLDELETARRMEDLVAYVDQYYMEELSLEKLSRRFFFSREHISRKFKQETGMPLSKYVTNRRINQSKQWLKETDKSIYSISLLLGYQDEKYFSKLFKKVVGMTPFEYRNSQ
ncbi:response regulator [Domibacillus sp. A3M-37]|uniref:response regulator transcription factor n=1 Tax=Domibacillus sp. A3M-37 TaxID=2962037 RepID=UPI0020B7AE50|nr:response regulator [Domibacillus sp. A3M-37]MCP3760935.1 response regulator [Domibacillus sp. A3M-37]